MWDMLWPVALVVLANTVYNICAKSTPAEANAFLSLSVTYLVAGTISLLAFWGSGRDGNILWELKQLNWAAPVLGLALVALEFGYISIYRAGWKVSMASLVGNICLACALLLVGLLLYREAISPRQVLGMLVCFGGLVLMFKA